MKKIFKHILILSLIVVFMNSTYFGASNVVKYDWVQVGDKWRYQYGDDFKKSQWIYEVEDGEQVPKYYVDENGYMAVGFKIIDGDFYFFRDDGTYQKDSERLFDGEYLVFATDGKIMNVNSQEDRERLIKKYESGIKSLIRVDADGQAIKKQSNSKRKTYDKEFDYKSKKNFQFESEKLALYEQNIENAYAKIAAEETILANVTPILLKLEKQKLLKEYSVDTSIDDVDTVTFGSYPQSDKSGQNKEPIEWVVVAKENDKVLLLSKYIIDCKCFNDESDYVVWADCDLRRWLNIDFYNKAFVDGEKKSILTTHLVNATEENRGRDSRDKETDDKIFCLSYDECIKYIMSEDAKDRKEYKLLATRGTDYARNVYNCHGKLMVSDAYNDNSSYWLRTLINFNEHILIVYFNGGIIPEYGGESCYSSNVGVRPAMWVKIN